MFQHFGTFRPPKRQFLLNVSAILLVFAASLRPFEMRHVTFIDRGEGFDTFPFWASILRFRFSAIAFRIVKRDRERNPHLFAHIFAPLQNRIWARKIQWFLHFGASDGALSWIAESCLGL